MKYLSVCSGIEAASVAWHPLGWRPVAFSEIEKFPGAVLAHHYPDVPNWGDMTKFKDWPDADVDVLVGGTPCQSFSVAGLRQGLADPRGNLCLTFLAIADKYRPEWVLFENVPGVLSSDGGRDFGAFLGGLGQLGYGWSYRVLDAQYVRVDGFGRAVPQRRRRVFVVGNLADWRRAAAVLFERESLQGHPAPRRQAGQGTSQDVVSSLVSSGRGVERTGETRGQDPVIAVAHSLRAEGFDAGEDGTGRGTPLVPVVAAQPIAFAHQQGGSIDLRIHDDGSSLTLQKSQGQAIAFSCKDHGADAGAIAPTLRSMGHNISHANAGGQLAVASDMRGREGGAQFEGPHDTANIRAASGGSSRSYVSQSWAVRRLTPTECERLQGFPDNWTNVPWRGKASTPDGPRYKALGNSMACNCMRWIGMRIQLVSDIAEEAA